MPAAKDLDFAGDTPATTEILQATRLPLQELRVIDHDDFSLVWPVVRALHKASPNRIVANVVPFLRVAFVAPQNVIKESRLPKSRQL